MSFDSYYGDLFATAVGQAPIVTKHLRATTDKLTPEPQLHICHTADRFQTGEKSPPSPAANS